MLDNFPVESRWCQMPLKTRPTAKKGYPTTPPSAHTDQRKQIYLAHQPNQHHHVPTGIIEAWTWSPPVVHQPRTDHINQAYPTQQIQPISHHNPTTNQPSTIQPNSPVTAKRRPAGQFPHPRCIRPSRSPPRHLPDAQKSKAAARKIMNTINHGSTFINNEKWIHGLLMNHDA